MEHLFLVCWTKRVSFFYLWHFQVCVTSSTAAWTTDLQWANSGKAVLTFHLLLYSLVHVKFSNVFIRCESVDSVNVKKKNQQLKSHLELLSEWDKFGGFKVIIVEMNGLTFGVFEKLQDDRLRRVSAENNCSKLNPRKCVYIHLHAWTFFSLVLWQTSVLAPVFQWSRAWDWDRLSVLQNFPHLC